MKRRRYYLVMCIAAVLLFLSSSARAQYVEITMDQLQRLMTEGKKAVLVDVRLIEEYRAGHIPGAIIIPAERILAERGRLPKDRSAPLIFYCRGVG